MNKGIGRERNLTKEIYNNENYFSIPQWSSYLQQINLIRECGAKIPTSEEITIAEIGKGAGILNQFLKYMNYSVTSFDVNPNLKPDKIVDISDSNNFKRGGGK